MHGVDKDLAAHITVTRQSGLVLCGKPIHEVFAAVPPACYLDSILADIGPGATLDSDPAYTLLNLCRTWAYLDDGLVRSKLQGGHWALSIGSKRMHSGSIGPLRRPLRRLSAQACPAVMRRMASDTSA